MTSIVDKVKLETFVSFAGVKSFHNSVKKDLGPIKRKPLGLVNSQSVNEFLKSDAKGKQKVGLIQLKTSVGSGSVGPHLLLLMGVFNFLLSGMKGYLNF